MTSEVFTIIFTILSSSLSIFYFESLPVSVEAVSSKDNRLKRLSSDTFPLVPESSDLKWILHFASFGLPLIPSQAYISKSYQNMAPQVQLAIPH